MGARPPGEQHERAETQREAAPYSGNAPRCNPPATVAGRNVVTREGCE